MSEIEEHHIPTSESGISPLESYPGEADYIRYRKSVNHETAERMLAFPFVIDELVARGLNKPFKNLSVKITNSRPCKCGCETSTIDSKELFVSVVFSCYVGGYMKSHLYNALPKNKQKAVRKAVNVTSTLVNKRVEEYESGKKIKYT